ncbi:MAG: ABC transporter permease [bacterium]
MHRMRAIFKKEIKQLYRDKRMLFVIFFFPVLMLVMFGYAVNFDVTNIHLAVYDLDKSTVSREFINSLSATSYFSIEKIIERDSEIKETLDKKDAQAVLVIPSGFSKILIAAKEPAKLQFLTDGVDGNTAMIIQNYVNAASLRFNQKIQAEVLADKGMKPFVPLNLNTTFWFNPDLETTSFLIPGLIAIILIVTSVVTVSLSIVREKERGTIEQINVSSIKTIELLLGKSFPYLMIAFFNAIFILIAGYILFGVEVKGSFLLLFISTIIFLFACTSMGIMISSISDSQQISFSLATFASLLPSLILSGFVFPIESMPYIIRVLTNITPTKFFISTLRAIILKGVGLQVFYMDLVYLLIFAFLMLLLASVINKRNLQTV